MIIARDCSYFFKTRLAIPVVREEKNNKKDKKKSTSWRGMLPVCLVMLCIIVAVAVAVAVCGHFQDIFLFPSLTAHVPPPLWARHVVAVIQRKCWG